jgi:hypothetical protein
VTPIPTIAWSVAAALAAGCGSDPAPVSDAAVTLALRHPSSVALDEDLAVEYQATLSRIWEVEPRVRCVTARPAHVPRTLDVRSAPETVAEAWRAGLLETGRGDLDELLEAFALSSVEEASDRFRLRFDSDFREAGLAAELEALDLGLDAQALPLGVDGDDIELASPRAAVATFRHRSGDCISGCMDEHVWVFERTGDGFELASEGGAPLEPAFEDCASPPGRQRPTTGSR